MSLPSNLLLNEMPEPQRSTLLANLKPVNLTQHHVLFEARAEMDTVYFPLDAVVSLVVPLATGTTVEAAMVGREGVVGASAAISGRISLNRGVVQLAGRCLQCEAQYLQTAVEDSSAIRALINAHEQALFGQAQQLAACNVMHGVENRMACWLLRAHDGAGKDELNVTQEHIAEMLGVRRTTVSLVAHTLQTAGLIRYRRGRIQICDIDGLQEGACECYQTVRLNYDALMKPSNPKMNTGQGRAPLNGADHAVSADQVP